MTTSTIQELRTEIDALNLDILKLLSRRASIAKEIGGLQSNQGFSQYDPKRELEMLQALTEANQGPFSDATIKDLFKNIFQASMETGKAAEKPKFRTSRAGREDTVVMIGDIPVAAATAPGKTPFCN